MLVIDVLAQRVRMSMANIAKYKSRRSSFDHSESGTVQTVRVMKRMMRRNLRRQLKKADDETGAVCSGTYWN
jgi:hypothetical protein